MKVKQVAKDFTMNFLASIIVTIMLQIVIYPYLAQKYSSEIYGNILLIVGFVNVIVGVIGNTLNNTRLIKEISYQDLGKKGDFQCLITIMSILGALGTFIFASYCNCFSRKEIFFIAIYSLIGIVRSYYIVEYRLELNFKKQIQANIFLLLGYAGGIAISIAIKNWVLIFVIGEIVSCFFTLLTSNLKKEPFEKTVLLKSTLICYVNLILLGLTNNLLSYCDRFLIYPLLGPTVLSIYTVAAFFGKSMGIIVEPIANVLLSYFTKKNFKITCKKYLLLYICSIGLCALFLLIGKTIAPLVLRIIYPTLFGEADNYFISATIANLLLVSTTLIRPVVLTYSKTSSILILQIIYAIIYFGLSWSLSKIMGLNGFILGCIISGIFNSICYFVLGLFSIKKRK